MTSGRPLNYTTAIPVTQTVTECQSILAAAGAASVAVHFEDGQPAGLSFQLVTPHGRRSFTLPVNIDGIQAVLAKMLRENPPHLSRRDLDRLRSRAHASAVGWRVLKDWLEANLALIAAEMATIDEVMLPYLHVGEDKTLWQAYQEREQAALTAGGLRPAAVRAVEALTAEPPRQPGHVRLRHRRRARPAAPRHVTPGHRAMVGAFDGHLAAGAERQADARVQHACFLPWFALVTGRGGTATFS